MKKININKSFKGFSLVELLIVVAFIASAFAVVYNWASNQYAKAQATQAVLQLERLKDKIAEASTIVSTKDPNLGLTVLSEIVKVENLIANKMVTNQEIANDSKIINVFKTGEVKTSARVMNANATGLPVLLVPAYTLILEGVPKNSCGYIFSNLQAKEYSEVKVANIMAKNVGQSFNPTVAAGACAGASGDFVTIEFTQTITEGRLSFGDDATDYTGASGRFIDSFNPANRATIAVNGSGAPVACIGGTVSSANGNYCSCPAGTMLHGDRCEAIGTPGVCPLGQGWSLKNKACEVLPNVPLQGQAAVSGVYTHGQYVPNNVAANLAKTDYHGSLTCDGELKAQGVNEFANVQDKMNGVTVTTKDVPADRYDEQNGTLCGVCLFGEVLDAEGRCTAFKE